MDVLGRVLAEEIGRAHGPSMVIENRPGAGTVIATEIVSRAPPDGNTLLMPANVRERLFAAPHFGRTWHLADIRVVLGDVRFRG